MGKLNCRRLNQTRPIVPFKRAAAKSRLMKGQDTVEFAIVSLLFFFLVFTVMDYARIFFVQMNVQQAVIDGGRFASTGNHTVVTVAGKPTTLSRMQSIINYIQNEISVPGINVQSSLIVCSTSGGCSNGGGSIPAGAPGDTVTIKLPASLPLTTANLAKLFTGGAYTFTASTTFRNEPFDRSNEN